MVTEKDVPEDKSVAKMTDQRELPELSEIWKALENVKDPEIPVISVIELGLIRDVSVTNTGISVMVTPTFSGCPALEVIEAEIEACIHSLGVEDVAIERVLDPPWSTDWITAIGREKLKEFGLSPPPIHGGELKVTFYEAAACPYCDSKNTSLRNSFGSSLCRAIYFCNNCNQPFEQFKPL